MALAENTRYVYELLLFCKVKTETTARGKLLLANLLKDCLGYKTVVKTEGACFTSAIGVPQKSLRNKLRIGVMGLKSLLSRMAETSSNTKPHERLFQ